MLKVPLLREDSNDVEMMDVEIYQNIKETLKNHQEFVEKNNDCNVIKDELIEILGGMNEILKMCLKINNPNHLNNHQITEINELLTNPTKSSLNNDIITLHLYFYDTLAHYICGTKFGKKLLHFVMNKYSLIIIMIMMLIITGILALHMSLHYEHWQNVIITLWIGVCSIYFMLTIICANKQIIPYIAMSFDFWVKIIYCFECSFFHYIYYHETQSESRALQSAFKNIFGLLLVIIFISILDGLKIPHKLRIFCSLSVAVLGSFKTLQWKLWKGSDNPHIFVFEVFGKELSVNAAEMIGDSYGILSLFVWKQTILSIIRKHKATMINKAYNIKWISG